MMKKKYLQPDSALLTIAQERKRKIPTVLKNGLWMTKEYGLSYEKNFNAYDGGPGRYDPFLQ